MASDQVCVNDGHPRQFVHKCGDHFYETLKNYIDTMMTDEDDSIETLINMLLYSTSSTTNWISFEESQPMRDLVVDFLVASIDWRDSL